MAQLYRRLPSASTGGIMNFFVLGRNACSSSPPKWAGGCTRTAATSWRRGSPARRLLSEAASRPACAAGGGAFSASPSSAGSLPLRSAMSGSNHPLRKGRSQVSRTCWLRLPLLRPAAYLSGGRRTSLTRVRRFTFEMASPLQEEKKKKNKKIEKKNISNIKLYLLYYRKKNK